MVVMTVVTKKNAPSNFHWTPALWGIDLTTLLRITSNSRSLMLYLVRSSSSSASNSALSVSSNADSRALKTAAPTSRYANVDAISSRVRTFCFFIGADRHSRSDSGILVVWWNRVLDLPSPNADVFSFTVVGFSSVLTPSFKCEVSLLRVGHVFWCPEHDRCRDVGVRQPSW